MRDDDGLRDESSRLEFGESLPRALILPERPSGSEMGGNLVQGEKPDFRRQGPEDGRVTFGDGHFSGFFRGRPRLRGGVPCRAPEVRVGLHGSVPRTGRGAGSPFRMTSRIRSAAAGDFGPGLAGGISSLADNSSSSEAASAGPERAGGGGFPAGWSTSRAAVSRVSWIFSPCSAWSRASFIPASIESRVRVRR